MSKLLFIARLVLILALTLACTAKVTSLLSHTSETATLSPTQTNPSTLSITQAEEVPFEICGESNSWIRPSAEQQNQKWWTFGRYANIHKEFLNHYWTNTFFVAYGHASPEFDLVNLTGLWTLPEGVRDRCLEPQKQDRVLKLEVAEIWVLLHEVKRVTRTGSAYVINVAPTTKGA